MNSRRSARLLALLTAAACRSSDPTASSGAVTRLPAGALAGEHWDWNGIIGTGQSLSVGAEGIPVRATQPSFGNLKLDLGSSLFPALSHDSRRLSLVPLREPIRPLATDFPSPYPRNVYGETPHTSMASQISAAVRAATQGQGEYVTVHSVVGESGQALSTIAKGARETAVTGHAYRASLFEARAISRLAKQAQRSFGVSAIVLTHGEADAQNPDYEAGLYRLVRDYDADLRSITGQTRAARLFVTQQSSSPMQVGTLAASALAAFHASERHAEEIVLVGPRYQYEYAPDAIHLTALGYDRLGEKYGETYFEKLVRGTEWRALSPLRVERRGDVVSVEFHVPVPPLAWDESLPSPHGSGPNRVWAAGRGFELSDSSGPIAIDAARIVGNKVELVARDAPRGGVMVRYAATAAPAPRAGGSWRWGQLRDSDPFVGQSSHEPQPNYAVCFELPVPEPSP